MNDNITLIIAVGFVCITFMSLVKGCTDLSKQRSNIRASLYAYGVEEEIVECVTSGIFIKDTTCK